jgi:hypothetical protein
MGCGGGVFASPNLRINFSSFAACVSTSSQSRPSFEHSMARFETRESLLATAAFASFIGSTCSTPSQKKHAASAQIESLFVGKTRFH